MNIVLTKVTTPIIGWVGTILGWIINGIYTVLEAVGITNIGLAIILFTLVVYLLMTPLQIKQQKFSKLNVVMQPELQKIQKKYKNKKDNESMMKQNEELNAVYAKYGVSPSGSCVQLLVQMPVLLALYQVIYRIPGYITGVKEVFVGLAEKITSVDGYADIISKFMTDNRIAIVSVKANSEFTTNTVVDFLYNLSPSQMEKFSELSQFSGMTELFESVAEKASHMNNFLGLNISDTPMAIAKAAMSEGAYVMLIAAVLIPVLAWFTQWLNYKLMPQQPTNNNGQPSTMESTMKSMNTVMPIMSAFFCFSFPVGIGIYWVIGAVIRCVQQVVINKYLNSMDLAELVSKNQEKMNKKLEKQGLSPQKINQQARMNVRSIQEAEKLAQQQMSKSSDEKAEERRKATEYYKNTNYKPGSLAAKANMVKQFEEKSKKK